MFCGTSEHSSCIDPVEESQATYSVFLCPGVEWRQWATIEHQLSRVCVGPCSDSIILILPILHNINSFCVCCSHDMCPEVSNWTQKKREPSPSWVIVSRVEVGPMNVIKMNLLMVWIFRSTNYWNHFLSLSEGFLVDVWSIPSWGVKSVGHAFTSYFCALCPH